MKFKRNGYYIEIVCAMLIGVFGCLIYFIVDYAGKEMIFLFLGMALFILLFYTALIRGLFYDTVYCDEKGIKVVTRKKTTEISWNEVYKVERIFSRNGVVGWTIVAVSGEEISALPFEFGTKKRFKKYMQSKLPHLEIK